ncbi:MAG: SusC/RagA family TonB-linked outer membrane protein [Flavisolibacter sp.]
MRFLTKTLAATTVSFALVFALMSPAAIAQNKEGALWVTTPKVNLSFAELFKTIQKQTGYTLFYSNATLDDSQKMKFSNAKIRLEDLLSEVLTPKNIDWLFKDQLIILRKKNVEPATRQAALFNADFREQAQVPPTLITGKVLGADGSPLAGASVLIKDTRLGTTTNQNGYFQLQAEEANGVLLVSSVGYQNKEVSIGGKTSFTIVLTQLTSQLSDVVVVGYGSRKKSDLTGAVTSLSAKSLKDRAAVNFGEAIAGQMAGVQVQQINGSPGGEGLSIRVRGTGSITQSNSPLYVVDGYPMEDGAFRLINPLDIESIQVLKDASSTAIYGSRGANGVVIITTKKGRSGEPVVSLNAFSGYQQKSKSIAVMNRDQYVQWFIDGRNQAWLDQPIINADPNKSPHTINDPNSRRKLYSSASSLYMIPDGQGGYQYNFMDPASVAQMPDNNWENQLFQTAPQQQYEVSVTGGSDRTTYAFSGSYLNQKGISLFTDYQRFNFHNNIESQLSKRIKIGLNLNAYSANGREQANGKDAPILYALTLPPIYPLHNVDGSYGGMVRNPEILAGDVANPIGIATQVERYRRRYGWLGTLYSEVEVLDNLRYRININGGIQNNNYENFEPSNVDLDGSKAPRPAKGVNEISADYDWVMEQTLTYARKLAPKHDIVLLGGFSTQQHSNDYMYGEARGFPNDNIHTLNAGTMYQLTSSKSAYSMISYFGRVNYSFNNRYLLTGTVRTDGSSRFGENKKWGVFPSVSGAWRVSEEPFMATLPMINDLKLRASYGIAGNNRIGNYSAIGLLSTGFYPTGDALQNTVSPSTIANPNLGWEKVLQADVGFDLGLFNNRIRLEADYYNSKSIDLLLNVPVPTITGYSSQIQNIGKVQNTGLEFLLTTRNLTGPLSWTSDFNIAFNKNKVLAVGPGGQPIYASAPNANNAFITEPGYPIASFYGYVYEGVFTDQRQLDAFPHLPADKVGDGHYLDVNGDGKLDQTDKTIIGNNQPKFEGGLGNNFSWKHLSLSTQLTFSYGAKLFSFFKRMVDIYHGDRNSMVEQTGRWRSPDQPGDGFHFRATRNPTGWQRDPSSAWVTDGSFLRLRNITLGYDLGALRFRTVRISSARIYLTGQNLLTWTKYPGFDPETSSEGDGLARGGDYMGYPAARSLILGVNLSF